MNNYLRADFYNYFFVRKDLRLKIKALNAFTCQVVIKKDNEELALNPITSHENVKGSYFAQPSLFTDVSKFSAWG